MLENPALRKALDVQQESATVRERYGFYPAPVATGEVNGGGGEMGVAREMRGQNLLIARRLVEAGVPFVNVYDFKQQGQKLGRACELREPAQNVICCRQPIRAWLH